jgi:hypothetical protein
MAVFFSPTGCRIDAERPHSAKHFPLVLFRDPRFIGIVQSASRLLNLKNTASLGKTILTGQFYNRRGGR